MESFIGVRDFLSVGRSLEKFSATFMEELELQESLTDKLMCQVLMCLLN